MADDFTTGFMDAYAEYMEWSARGFDAVARLMCEQYSYSPTKKDILKFALGWIWGKTSDAVEATVQTAILEMKLDAMYIAVAKENSWEVDLPQVDFLSKEKSTVEIDNLFKSIGDLNLSARARKGLARIGLSESHTVAELIQKTPKELLYTKNFGTTSLNEVRLKLKKLNLRLRNDGNGDKESIERTKNVTE